MGRGVDVVKRQEWRSRFRRFSKLGQTVAEFCDWEGVSVATFYNWRRRCDANPEGRERETRPTERPRLAKSSFLPVRLTSARELSATSTPGDLEYRRLRECYRWPTMGQDRDTSSR